MRFGTWIRAHRLRRGMSMDRVCQEADLSKAYLSLIETGQKGPPKDDVVSQIARAMELDEQDLLMRAHRERYPEDVTELRQLIYELRNILAHILEAGAEGEDASGEAPPAKSMIKALGEALSGLERLVPSDSGEAGELLSELNDLRAEEREFVLSVVHQVKTLRPRRGPQGGATVHPRLVAGAKRTAKPQAATHAAQ